MRTPTRFKVTAENGQTFTWSFVRLERVCSTLGRRLDGWELVTHDGCERFSEGGWVDFVPFVRLVASNYGFTTNLS